MNIKVIVAAHKKFAMPKDEMYLPLHVGKEGKEDIGYQGDNTGENISAKNPYFCELTGLYWAWKNLDADYIGLAHYRRHFSLAKKLPKEEEKKFELLLSKEQAEQILSEYDIILPKKREYYIENLYDHYKHSLHIETLDAAGEILREEYPEYYPEFENLKKRTGAHMFNMMIMSKPLFDAYCAWLFEILFELERRIDPKQYDAFHARYPGRVSELLLDIWIRTNGLSYKEVPVADMQGVNWWKKGTAFLRAKFIGQKYDKSF